MILNSGRTAPANGRSTGALLVALLVLALPARSEVPLGLPPVPVPADNPVTPAKVALGARLFTDLRFSRTGTIACATCHDPVKAFTDSPLETSEGVNHLNGTRNAPTLANVAYYRRFFWDGRSRSLEDQSRHPFVNPVEMGLPDFAPILDLIHSDPEYVRLFREAFGTETARTGMPEVSKALASYERTLVYGDSPFDRWFYGHDAGALTVAAQRGFKVFMEQGRCQSCHTIEGGYALFTDNRFHNIGVGIQRVEADLAKLETSWMTAKARGINIDKSVLSNDASAELGHFALSDAPDDIGAFKTPSLRNVALTPPYMHDGSLATLRDVIQHYDHGGVLDASRPVSVFVSSGIRPLHLTDAQIDDLIAFLESLTSPSLGSVTAVERRP
jgi:cytochrome c peroxidase